jgi:hypothetical protein
MVTIHEEATRRSMEKALKEEPGYAALLTESHRLINSDFYGQFYTDCVVQTFREITLYDTHAFLQIHAHIQKGDIDCFDVEIGDEPSGDTSEDRNNQSLLKLPPPFSGHFQGGTQSDSDGWIKWSEEIQLTCIPKSGEPSFIKTIEPGLAVLEVGYTHASKTHIHLAMDRKLARWPYGSTTLRIFRVLNDSLWRL